MPMNPLAAIGPVPPCDAGLRLRAFKAAFHRIARDVARDRQGRAVIDDAALACAFFDWAGQASGPDSPGRLFQRLLHHAPLTMEAVNPACAVWPEGVVLIRMCFLVGDARPDPVALADPALWRAARDAILTDSGSVSRMLARFARLDGPAVGPELHIVRPRPDLRWPRWARVGVLWLDAVTDASDLRTDSLGQVLAAHGVGLPHDEVRRRFDAGQLGAAMTHVAQVTGQVCARSFGEDYRAMLAERLSGGLTPDPGAERLIAHLRDLGVAIRIVAPGFPAVWCDALPDGWRALAVSGEENDDAVSLLEKLTSNSGAELAILARTTVAERLGAAGWSVIPVSRDADGAPFQTYPTLMDLRLP